MATVTYFETVHTSFADVPVTDAGVDTVTFLKAAEGVVELFDLLNSKAFSVVQADLTGNIKKVRTYQEAHPEEGKTLEGIIASEPNHDKKLTATQGLLWLLRGLQFTYIGMLRLTTNKTEEVSAAFRDAYDQSLKTYHTWIVQKVFTVAMTACPYRVDFYAKLGSPVEKVDVELEKWLVGLDIVLKREQGFMANPPKGL